MVFSVAAALLAGSFAFTYWVLSQDARKNPRYTNLERLRTQPPGIVQKPLAAVPKVVVAEERTHADAVFVRRIVFTKCGNQVVEEKRIPEDLAGLTRSQVTAKLKGAWIESFDPSRVVVQETRDTYCPQHATGRYLGVADGHLAVYDGEPGNGGRPVEIFDLPVSDLPEREVQDLRRGIPVATDSEMRQMLQGYLEQAGY